MSSELVKKDQASVSERVNALFGNNLLDQAIEKLQLLTFSEVAIKKYKLEVEKLELSKHKNEFVRWFGTKFSSPGRASAAADKLLMAIFASIIMTTLLAASPMGALAFAEAIPYAVAVLVLVGAFIACNFVRKALTQIQWHSQYIRWQDVIAVNELPRDVKLMMYKLAHEMRGRNLLFRLDTIGPDPVLNAVYTDAANITHIRPITIWEVRDDGPEWKPLQTHYMVELDGEIVHGWVEQRGGLK